MQRSLLLFLLLISIGCRAQEDFSWWVNIHHWDGHTPWNEYMTMSAAFMGPNALPVPEVMKGSVDSSVELELSGDYIFSRGDKTKDFFTRGYLPLYDNRFAVSIDVIPYEWFKTDTLTRDIRAARGKSGKGGAGGDIYFYTIFQILRNKNNGPDLALRAAFRLASGTNLRNARYTDGPGYFFDLSAGKNYSLKESVLRIYAMSGVYIYQTYDLQHLQNDCFLFGGGADLTFKKIILSQSVGGYSGYLDIGDKPLVYRASIQLVSKKIDWKFSYQWGIRNYDFQRIRVGVVFHTNALQRLLNKNK